jgi:hypothetical protein
MSASCFVRVSNKDVQVEVFKGTGPSHIHSAPLAESWKTQVAESPKAAPLLRLGSRTFWLVPEPEAQDPILCVHIGLYTSDGEVQINFQETVIELSSFGQAKILHGSR